MPDPSPKRIRRLYRRRLRPNKVENYLLYHSTIPPELEAVYREHGITSISSFLQGPDLCVLVEFDRDIYPDKAKALDNHPLELQWQSVMHNLCDNSFETLTYQEVYRLSGSGRE